VSWLIRDAAAARLVGWNAQWQLVPSPIRRRWWKDVGWGLLLVQILTLLLVAGTRHLEREGMLTAEADLLELIGRWSWISFNDAIWLDVFGNGFVLTPLMVAAAWLGSRGRSPFVSPTLLIGYGSLFLPVISAWIIWSRARPTVIANGIGSPGASLSSFPSGHLVQAIVAFGVLAFLWGRATRSTGERLLVAAGFLALTTITTLARLRLGAHWPTDMVAAWVIGLAWVFVMARALVRAEAAAAAPARMAGSAVRR
jgi:undecaprenyl-diphosphatase